MAKNNICPHRKDNPLTISFDLGIKFLKCHVDLTLDEGYLERRANETVRSKCRHHACH